MTADIRREEAKLSKTKNIFSKIKLSGTNTSTYPDYVLNEEVIKANNTEINIPLFKNDYCILDIMNNKFSDNLSSTDTIHLTTTQPTGINEGGKNVREFCIPYADIKEDSFLITTLSNGTNNKIYIEIPITDGYRFDDEKVYPTITVLYNPIKFPACLELK
jgi:hypothetical protein